MRNISITSMERDSVRRADTDRRLIRRFGARAAAAGLAALLLAGCADGKSQTTPPRKTNPTHLGNKPKPTAPVTTPKTSTTTTTTPPAEINNSQADSLYPCSLVPQSIMDQLDVNAPDTLLPGLPYQPGQTLSCSMLNPNQDWSLAVNTGSSDPSGTSNYKPVTLPGGLQILEKTESYNGGSIAFVQYISKTGEINSPTNYWGDVGCDSCSIDQALNLAVQIAKVIIPEEQAQGGMPSAGQLVTNYSTGSS